MDSRSHIELLQPSVPGLSNHSTAAGTTPVAMIAAMVSAASRALANAPIRLCVTSATGRSTTNGFGDDPQGSFRADEDTERVRAVVVGAEGELPNRPAGQRRRSGRRFVVTPYFSACGPPAFSMMLPAAGQVRRHGIGREAQTVWGQRLAQVGVDHTRLYTGTTFSISMCKI